MTRRAANMPRLNGGPPLGSALLVMIFAVLCLSVFALLTFSTAMAGHRLSQETADAICAYYQADSQAEQVLAALRQQTDGETAVAGITVTRTGDGVYAYQVPIDARQALAVEVYLPATGGCEVLRWQAVSIAGWQADDRLPIWDGSGAL